MALATIFIYRGRRNYFNISLLRPVSISRGIFMNWIAITDLGDAAIMVPIALARIIQPAGRGGEKSLFER
jgi:hypothetical protein